jgi:hypothetical protein
MRGPSDSMYQKEQCKAKGYGSKTYVLNVDMHCECTGCTKKITDGIKEISLAEGAHHSYRHLFVTAYSACLL